MAINEALKKAIEEIKIRFKFKQAEIAEKLGVKSTYLSDMINGRVPLSENIINKVHELFHISITTEKEVNDQKISVLSEELPSLRDENNQLKGRIMELKETIVKHELRIRELESLCTKHHIDSHKSKVI